MIGIYMITSPSGKVYIGQSINIEKRKSYYNNTNCKKQAKLYHSLKKYGFKKHLFEVLYECTQDELTSKEAFYMKKYNSIVDGLNLKEAGPHGKLSKETRLKISIGNKGKKKALGSKRSDEHKERMSKLMKGRPGTFKGRKHTAATKLKMSKAMTGLKRAKGRKLSPEHCKAISESKIGIKLSDSHKENLSKAHIGIPNNWEGRKHSPESIQKMADAKRGKVASTETKKKMSLAHKKRFGGIETLSTAI